MNKNAEAITLMKQNKYEEAASLFTEIIETNPKDPVGYINFGNLLLHMNELDRAQRFFDKSIELEENAATAYYGLGNLYFEKTNYQKAQENFQKAIELGLEESDVYFILGMTLLKQELQKLALPYLLRATELDQHDDEKLFQYGLTLALIEHIEDAKKIFNAVLKLNSRHSDAHYNLGVIAMYDNQPTGAMHHFNEALSIQPDHVLAANGKSKIEELLDNNEA